MHALLSMMELLLLDECINTCNLEEKSKGCLKDDEDKVAAMVVEKVV